MKRILRTGKRKKSASADKPRITGRIVIAKHEGVTIFIFPDLRFNAPRSR